MPIITTAEYKAYAGISGTSQDAQLNILIPAIQARLETLCNRHFDAAVYIENIDGGGPSVQVRNFPIIDLQSVTITKNDGTVLYTYAVTAYREEDVTGLVSIQRCSLGGVADTYSPLPSPMTFGPYPQFPDGFRNVQVTYEGGYEDADMPLDLKYLMYELVTTALANIPTDESMKSEKLGHYAYTRIDGSWWSQFTERIQAWKGLPT